MGSASMHLPDIKDIEERKYIRFGNMAKTIKSVRREIEAYENTFVTYDDVYDIVEGLYRLSQELGPQTFDVYATNSALVLLSIFNGPRFIPGRVVRLEMCKSLALRLTMLYRNV